MSELGQGNRGASAEHSRPRRSSQREFGRYRIDGLIGRGGMASVHRAYDTARGHFVALKRLELPTSFTSGTAGLPATQQRVAHVTPREAARRRAQLTALFQREYRTLAQLAHPCIVEVYDSGLFDDRPYYTMELLDGRDLGRSGRLHWHQVSAIMCDVASALTLLHARRLLHRDVAPRNVHCSPDGRAKLLDFGAMSSMGVSELLVGTPAFVAPEAAQRLPLDARCDLYALGAVGYTLLTGDPPYPAQSFRELSDAQRRAPPTPSSVVPDVPKPLEALIMQLIQLERAARPSSAVEVVERLRALTGTAHDAKLAIADAYLSAPTLVGREIQLSAIRRRALRAQRRPGSSLQLIGAPGSGRTRLLDECALEGKLAGALVLRVAPEADGGELSALRSLFSQLHATQSESERRAAPLPVLLSERLLCGSAAPNEHDELARASHDYLFQLAKNRPLMILVDDFERIDRGSAALFASLSQATGNCHLVLVSASSLEAFGTPDPTQRVLGQHSLQLTLPPLTAADTQALTRSICGDVPNLQLLADRLQALSAGSPKLCLELTRHLIERQTVRYEAGGFVLPATLSADDFPKSLDSVLRARFASLSGGARELGAAIALCAGATLTVGQCVRLVPSEDLEQAQRTFCELNRAELLLVRGGAVSLRQNAFGAALLAFTDAAQQKALHARLASVLREDAVQHVSAAEHYFRADQPQQALALLLAAAENDSLFQEWFARLDALLATALDTCHALGRPARDAFMLRRARARHRVQFIAPGDREQLVAYARELEPLTGLHHYHALDPALNPRERLARALAQAQASFDATPERDRLYSPIEALTELATYTAALAGYAVSTADTELRAQLPSLEPFAPLSAAIDFTHKICRAMSDVREGRHQPYYAALDELMLRLSQPDRSGLPERNYLRARLGIVYMLATADATLGRPEAFQRADELEATPQSRGLAWRSRYLAHLYRGDLQRASKCQREYEWLMLQEDYHNRYQNSSLETEFLFFARIDDLLGLRRMLPEIERMGARFPGWQAFVCFARGELERVRGNHPLALAHSERALNLTEPGKHDTWAYAAALHVRLLVDVQRADAALAFGKQACREMQLHGLELICSALLCAVAEAHSALGDHACAIVIIEDLLASLTRLRIQGMYAGLWCEERARLALRVGDTPGFWHWYRRGIGYYGDAPDSPFAPRIARLLHEERELRGDRNHASPLREQLGVRLRRELAACPSATARAELGLSRLLELTASDAGCLFGVRDNRLVPLAALGHATASEALAQRLYAHLAQHEIGGSDDTPIIDAQGGIVTPQHLAVTDDERRYWALAIPNSAGAIVALAAISSQTDLLSKSVLELLHALGDVLYSQAEVEAFEA